MFVKNHLYTAWGLLTRIDLTWIGLHSNDAPLPSHGQARTCWAFPIIGALIGAICAVVWYVAHLVLIPPVVAAGLAVLTGVLVTGGLHEDGLADTADGLFGPMERSEEQRLAIMRDPHLGSFAVIALFLSLSLRIASLSSQNLISGIVMLIIAHSVSRALMTRFLTQPLARQDGMAAHFIGASNNSKFNAQSLLTLKPIPMLLNAFKSLSFSVTLAGFMADFVLCIAWYFDFVTILQIFALYVALIIILGGFGFMARLRLGGMTGDIYGAAQQIAECAAMIFLTIPLSFWTNLSW